MKIAQIAPLYERVTPKLYGGTERVVSFLTEELVRQGHDVFGLVMIEAMACGTPVIASRRGSVPEIVEEGVSGFVVDTIEEAVTAVGRIGRVVFGQAHLRRILGKYAAIIMNRAFIARWGMLHSIGRLSASASSHPGLSLAAFITNIAESDFRYTHRMKDQLSKASAAWVVSQFEFWAI